MKIMDTTNILFEGRVKEFIKLMRVSLGRDLELISLCSEDGTANAKCFLGGIQVGMGLKIGRRGVVGPAELLTEGCQLERI